MKRGLVLIVSLVMVAATACGAPTGLSAEHQELATYLSSMYRIQGDQMSAMSGLMPGSEALETSTQEELLAQQQEIDEQVGAVLKQYIADLKAIDPPERAADFHAELIASAEIVGEDALGFLDDLASGDPDLVVQAQQEQAALLEEVFADSQGMGEELAAIVGEVLADRDDPESVYILGILTSLTEGGIEAAQDLVSGLETIPNTPKELTDLIDQTIGVFETVRAEHAAITPPVAWADLHAERIAILDDGIVLYSRFGAIMSALLEDPESVDLDEFQQVFKDLLDWIGRTPAWTAAFSYQLAEYFEGLA